jgi:hypothetical protein
MLILSAYGLHDLAEAVIFTVGLFHTVRIALRLLLLLSAEARAEWTFITSMLRRERAMWRRIVKR